MTENKKPTISKAIKKAATPNSLTKLHLKLVREFYKTNKRYPTSTNELISWANKSLKPNLKKKRKKRFYRRPKK